MGATVQLSRSSNATSADQVTQVGTNSQSVLDFWLSLHIISGHILLPILVFIFVFRTTRHPALVNLCMVTIVTSICACMLFYTGTQKGPEPAFGLCLAHAALGSGVQPVLVTAAFALVYQVWSSVFGPKRHQQNSVWQSVKSFLLLTVPWLTFAAFVIAGAVVGFQNPKKVSRNRRFFYCSINVKSFSRAISIFCAVNLFLIMLMEFFIAWNIFRNWRAVKKGMKVGDVNYSMTIRLVFFEIYIFTGTVLSLLALNAPKSPIPDLWLASIGLCIVLIFGTQRDVWDALKCFPTTKQGWKELRFWKPKPHKMDLLA